MSEANAIENETTPAAGQTLHQDTSFLQVLYRSKQVNDLDTRARINLQQELIDFLKDPDKWLYLSRAEQRKLLYRLRPQQKMATAFTSAVKIKCFDDEGSIVTKDVILQLDANRNRNLELLFNQIINPDIASIFFEEFCFGLLELIDKLIHIQSVTLHSLDALLTEQNQADLRLYFPFSAQELTVVHDSGNGFEIQLIPRFLRLPLNKLFYAVKRAAPDFPSLVLQFYLDQYFLSDYWIKKYQGTEDNARVIRIFLAKAFHAIHRASGLTTEHLDLPEANHTNRFQYLTITDEDTALLFSQESSLNPAQLELRDKFKQFLAQPEPPEDTKQRRVVTGPSVKVELTLEKVLEEVFTDYSDRYQVHWKSHDFTRPIWLPQENTLGTLSLVERQALKEHLTEVMRADYQSQLATSEVYLLHLWTEMAEKEYENEATHSQLKALGVSKYHFSEELMLLLAKQHRTLVSQNAVDVVKGIVQHLTLMVRLGTLSLEMLIQQRYDRISSDVLPYLYHVRVPNQQGDLVWQPSPYPFGTMLYVLKVLPDLMQTETEQTDQTSINLARNLLQVLCNFERKQAEEYGI